MFAGWSTATVTSSGGGGSSGSGWSTGSGSTSGGGSSGWSTGDSGSSGGGGWSTAPATQTYTAPSYQTSYPAGYSYYPSSISSYALPGAGLFAGPFGEGGPYTPLDFPLLHELRPGERLEESGLSIAVKSALPFVTLGVLAIFLLKRK